MDKFMEKMDKEWELTTESEPPVRDFMHMYGRTLQHAPTNAHDAHMKTMRTLICNRAGLDVHVGAIRSKLSPPSNKIMQSLKATTLSGKWCVYMAPLTSDDTTTVVVCTREAVKKLEAKRKRPMDPQRVLRRLRRLRDYLVGLPTPNRVSPMRFVAVRDRSRVASKVRHLFAQLIEGTINSRVFLLRVSFFYKDIPFFARSRTFFETLAADTESHDFIFSYAKLAKVQH